ncbi:hypothetical protein B0H67DRAFT_292181 [Lasiosphaeris hirsuta]|uniref:Uncharacterized protein n=1 Tax=Lasiosphaeris hirsuta TaxID=260670 RepID=A0AA40A8Y7_9PEZI|nr:hypothetical protein B0H67DRAFT_292181 [Lasiosphaeris hirsuta]
MRPPQALGSVGWRILRSLSYAALPTHAVRVSPAACYQQFSQCPILPRFFPSGPHHDPGRSNKPPAHFRHVVVKTKTLPKARGLRTASRPALTFSKVDVPPMEFWEPLALMEAPEDLTASIFYETAKQYCAIAQTGESTWKGKLERDYGIDSYTLHYTGLLLTHGPPGPTWPLGLNMLMTASSLEYDASAITLVRLLLQTKNGLEKKSYMEIFRPAVAHFNRIVKVGDNPDALTLQGLLLERKADNHSSLKSFERAIEAGNRSGDTYAPAQRKQAPGTGTNESSSSGALQRRTPKWCWEAACYVGRGRVLLQLGGRAAAEANFRIAARELDTAGACLLLGKLLPPQEAEEYLMKAAFSASEEACLLLAASEREKAMNHGELSEKEKDNRRRWAAEWFRLGRNEEAAEDVGRVTS